MILSDIHNQLMEMKTCFTQHILHYTIYYKIILHKTYNNILRINTLHTQANYSFTQPFNAILLYRCQLFVSDTPTSAIINKLIYIYG